MKIGLLANSTEWLSPFYEELSGRHDVWWGTHEKQVYDRLVKKYTNVCFEPFEKHTTSASGNRFSYGETGVAERILNERIAPDVWITDVANRIVKARKTCMWVYAFHSFCYKKYLFHESTEKFDLLLLPGVFLKDQYINKMRFAIDDERLAVTGFPKLDPIFQGKFSRRHTKTQLGLDPNRPTVLYAPTWGGASSLGRWGNQLWSRWPVAEHFDIFKKFVALVKANEANLIVKVHHISNVPEKRRLREFCLNEEVAWIEDDPGLMADILPIIDCSDVLVSDMSGAISEFAAFDKPVVCVEPESKAAWHESSIPRELLPAEPVRSVPELLRDVSNAIRNPAGYYLDRRRRVAETLFDYRDGEATRRACRLIESRLERNMTYDRRIS